MSFQNYLIPALERVLAWDIPEDACGYAVCDQAELMAGASPGAMGWEPGD